MKAFIEVIKRTYSIIKTHLCMYSDYRNYSTRLQYKLPPAKPVVLETHCNGFADYFIRFSHLLRSWLSLSCYKTFKGWRNNKYPESDIKNILSLIFDDRKTNSDADNIKVIYNHANPLHKRNHYIVEYNETKLYVKIFNNYNLVC